MQRLTYILLLFIQLVASQDTIKHQVYFETDKYIIPEKEKSRLLLFISEINTDRIEKIAIFGFCDDRGSDSYNMILSQQRADAIKQVLTHQNIDDSVITNVDGKGEILLNIVKETNLQKIRGLNRKVEIIVTSALPQEEIVEVSETAEVKPEDLTVEERLLGDLKEGEHIIVNNLIFRMGYSYLTPQSMKYLDTLADILVKRNDIFFTIEGHVCCTYGTRDAVDRKTKKRNLSFDRAKYIYDYLAKKGVRRYRMKYKGQKHKYPLGGPPELDKRVEIVIDKIVTTNEVKN